MPYCLLLWLLRVEGFLRLNARLQIVEVCPAWTLHHSASLFTITKAFGQSLMCTARVRVIQSSECAPLQHYRGSRKGMHMKRLLR